MSVYLGELCSMCKEGRMTHPRVCFYKCDNCGYAFTIDPVGRETIRIEKKPFTGGK